MGKPEKQTDVNKMKDVAKTADHKLSSAINKKLSYINKPFSK